MNSICDTRGMYVEPKLYGKEKYIHYRSKGRCGDVDPYKKYVSATPSPLLTVKDTSIRPVFGSHKEHHCTHGHQRTVSAVHWSRKRRLDDYWQFHEHCTDSKITATAYLFSVSGPYAQFAVLVATVTVLGGIPHIIYCSWCWSCLLCFFCWCVSSECWFWWNMWCWCGWFSVMMMKMGCVRLMELLGLRLWRIGQMNERIRWWHGDIISRDEISIMCIDYPHHWPRSFRRDPEGHVRTSTGHSTIAVTWDVHALVTCLSGQRSGGHSGMELGSGRADGQGSRVAWGERGGKHFDPRY